MPRPRACDEAGQGVLQADIGTANGPPRRDVGERSHAGTILGIKANGVPVMDAIYARAARKLTAGKMGVESNTRVSNFRGCRRQARKHGQLK